MIPEYLRFTGVNLYFPTLKVPVEIPEVESLNGYAVDGVDEVIAGYIGRFRRHRARSAI